MALGVLLRKGVRCPIGLSGALAVGVLGWIAAVIGPVWSASVAIPVLPWALVIMAAATADLTSGGLGSPRGLLVRLGELSYAFYLVHQLVLRGLTASGWPLDEWAYIALGLGRSRALIGS